MSIEELVAEKLYRRCDPDRFSFETNVVIDNGRARAVDVVRDRALFQLSVESDEK